MNNRDIRRPALVQVVLSLGAGGTERLVIDMTKLLSSRADVSVVCLDEPGRWAYQLEELGIPVTTLGRRPGFRPELVASVRGVLKSMHRPVVHCHHYTPFVYGMLAACTCPGSRVVYTEHGRYHDGPPSLKRRLANQLFGRLPGRFFAVSDDLREHLLREGFSPSRMHVNHNGIDVGELPGQAARTAARAELGLQDGDFVVGTVARLHPVKDLGTLVKACALRKDAGQRLVLVGDGEDREALEQLARELEATDNVLFAGQREDARTLLPAFDVFVNCSIIEGISVTVLEAMAAGVPVVATAVGGTPEIVSDGATALMVDSRAPEALAAAIGRLRDDPVLAGTLRDAARRRVEDEFSTERMVERYVDAYGWT